MLTTAIVTLLIIGIVMYNFFKYPNPNNNVKVYRLKLAAQRNILVLGICALLPATVFGVSLVYGLITNGLSFGIVGQALTTMWDIWYVYAVMVVISIVMSMRQLGTLDKEIVKMTKKGKEQDIFTGAKPASDNMQRDVADMCRYLGIKNVPTVMVLPANGLPNAFAIGTLDGKSAIALHGKLVNGLHADETNAVIAHELGHITSGDTQVRFLLSNLGWMRWLLYLGMLFALPTSFWGVLFVLGGIILTQIVLAPIAALMGLAIARRAEFNADAVAVEMQNSGAGMSNALLKLEAMYLSEAPLMMEQAGKMSRWYMMHPPTTERVNAARKLDNKD